MTAEWHGRRKRAMLKISRRLVASAGQPASFAAMHRHKHRDHHTLTNA
jgi:hypothetical protein